MKPALETSWLGLELSHPLVASAGPLTHELDGFRRYEDAGVSAIVMHSLFEEEIEHRSRATDHFLDYGAESYGESLTYFPELEDYGTGPDRYLSLLSSAVEAVDVPVIGSLNGVSPGGWRKFAEAMEEAGAAALELNLYHIATDPAVSGREVEELYAEAVREVSASLKIPLAVKLSPFLSAPAHMAATLAEAGASGLVLFNRFYQPDFDLNDLRVEPRLSLSHGQEMRLPLRWTAILFGRVDVDLGITSGVHTAEDVLKGVMAGASVTMMTSELLRHGLERVGQIREVMEDWMSENEYESVSQMRGSLSHLHTDEPQAFERANYMATLQSWRPEPGVGS